MDSLIWAGSQPLEAIGALLNTPLQCIPYALGLLLGWPFLTTSLRYRRLSQLKKKYNYPTRESMAKMTDEEAYEIQLVVGQLEFPFMFVKALQFALFRTYGIPSISGVLTKTSQFSNPETSLKRYNDTTALVNEMVANSPTSLRAFNSLARTRFLHSGYRASGTILDSDMLYTLALFALEPIKFINKFEWRTLCDLERCAIGTFWKSVGDALGIPFDELPSGKTGFKDGLHWLEEVEAWSQEYEARFMVPDVKNRETADQTMEILVYMVPKVLHPVGFQFVSFMMDDRLRKAMMYDAPPPFLEKVFASVLNVRKLFLRYFVLPRPSFMKVQNVSAKPDENDRYYLTSWEAAPYYVKPTFWNRWGPMAWLTWAVGRPVPGDDGDKYRPSGYHINDIGPKYFEGRGQKAIEQTMEELKVFRTGKCPFH
ncbi:hypothetical protein N7490_009949 [Penicillium lividum]|nr:hypothetical protein N7490_009949 [Penicillium lividum]